MELTCNWIHLLLVCRNCFADYVKDNDDSDDDSCMYWMLQVTVSNETLIIGLFYKLHLNDFVLIDGNKHNIP